MAVTKVPILGRRKELFDWLKELLGEEEAKGTYRVEITISATRAATMTVYRYARNEKGQFYLDPVDRKEAATREPYTMKIYSLPAVPALEVTCSK